MASNQGRLSLQVAHFKTKKFQAQPHQTMKTLTLSLILMISLTAESQWGLKAGPSFSYFAGGDHIYSGIQHAYGSITAGFFHMSKHLQVELNYSQGGARNSEENNRTFKTHNIVLPVTYLAHCGDFNMQAGMYVSRLVRASNYDFFTPGSPNFSWGHKWTWYDRWDYGLVGGIGVNLHPLYIELHGRHGLPNVRNELKGWNGQNDYNYWKCRNAALEVALYIPFKITQ